MIYLFILLIRNGIKKEGESRSMHGGVGARCEAEKERERFHRQHICDFRNTQEYKIDETNHVVAVVVGTRVSTNTWQCTFRSHLLFFFTQRSCTYYTPYANLSDIIMLFLMFFFF